MSKEQMRAEFEKNMRSLAAYGSGHIFIIKEDGTYENDVLNLAFDVHKLALESLPKVTPEEIAAMLLEYEYVNAADFVGQHGVIDVTAWGNACRLSQARAILQKFPFLTGE